ncbi:hypothetical protein [Pseudorhodoplanes sinuspersici]|uniref:Uncharacterized protein n=1 Tax=Pseudorhodoplanes sinuspersici TaxID=1235591 RepID=A0A1W6ZRI8_9HYPH|nr:hypothetical protein [Pseudorhodoplanes sinuspersici]ARP99730.1 hypothetical protein CAK95_12005 [Pseudorhodoplanes sinuspersici]RKE70718.1 hypothetical protein DFP91_2960 [Pseudorhodoplanes sinuspersici]
MICCSFFVLASAWIWRAGAQLALRLGSAVALAATAFSGAILIAEHIDHYRSRALANDRSIFAEIIEQPICTNTADSVRRIAAVMVPQNAQ